MNGHPTSLTARLRIALMVFLASIAGGYGAMAAAHGAYRNFTAAVYIPVAATRELADPQTLERSIRALPVSCTSTRST